VKKQESFLLRFVSDVWRYFQLTMECTILWPSALQLLGYLAVVPVHVYRQMQSYVLVTWLNVITGPRCSNWGITDSLCTNNRGDGIKYASATFSVITQGTQEPTMHRSANEDLGFLLVRPSPQASPWVSRLSHSFYSVLRLYPLPFLSSLF
jgi:hypothetical protein